jgi:hypothetical protein
LSLYKNRPKRHVLKNEQEAFKEGHAAKSAEERRHSNHNIRAHLGEIYNNSNNQSSSFPNNNKNI